MTIRRDILFGLEERHVAGNPKQNRLRRVTRLFLWGEYWFNIKKSWFNIKSCGMIWKVIIFDISLQREIKI
jgi:hypothetical protein